MSLGILIVGCIATAIAGVATLPPPMVVTSQLETRVDSAKTFLSSLLAAVDDLLLSVSPLMAVISRVNVATAKLQAAQVLRKNGAEIWPAARGGLVREEGCVTLRHPLTFRTLDR